MIQDITAIYHNQYKEQNPSVGDCIIFVKGRNVLIKKNTEEIEFLRYEEIEELEMSFRYLFAIDTEEGRKDLRIQYSIFGRCSSRSRYVFFCCP